MDKFDPKVLRQFAATYRRRADWEPDNAQMFRRIAADMEMHAAKIEGGGLTDQAAKIHPLSGD